MDWRKSTYSGENGSCLEVAKWRKSTYSGASGSDCVETATAQGMILVRDTTNRDAGTLTFPSSAWSTFTGAVKAK
jgi:Domain of unknown function (DUF397)